MTVAAQPTPQHAARLQRAALAYAGRFGWAVLPLHGVRDGRCTCGRRDCPSPGKHPLTKRGVHDASKNPDVIRAWWRRWPWANVAVATGAVSRIWALDVDPAAGGEDSLDALEAEHGLLPHTVQSLTGSGGRHILFRYPGQHVPNAVAIAPGLDVRGDGGYIVVAPSIHASGRLYAWELSSRPGEVELAAAPEWLLQLVGAGRRRGPGRDWRRDLLEGVSEGQRNVALTSIVGGLLRAAVPVKVALEFALWVNRHRFQPPLPEAEVLKVVDSIAAREARRRGGGSHRAAG